MSVLKDILKLWDPGTRAPRITILDGGYLDWLNRYPTLVTNPEVKLPDVQTNAMDEILEEVEYPDWLNSDDSSSPFNKLQIRSSDKNELKTKRISDNRRLDDLITSITTKEEISSRTNNKTLVNRNAESPDFLKSRNSNLAKYSDSTEEIKNPYKFVNMKVSEMSNHSRGEIENNSTEDMNVDEDEIIFETDKFPGDSNAQYSTAKPKIDRSSKPSSFVKTTSQASKQLLTLKSQLNELLKNLELGEKNILWIETEIYEQDENDNRISGEKSRRHSETLLKNLNIDVSNLVSKFTPWYVLLRCNDCPIQKSKIET